MYVKSNDSAAEYSQESSGILDICIIYHIIEDKVEGTRARQRSAKRWSYQIKSSTRITNNRDL